MKRARANPPGKLGRRAFVGTLFASAAGAAFGRTPVGGTLRLTLPFGGGRLDPHAADEPLAALFGPAVADPLFALDGNGRPYPTLASSLPERTAKGARVVLRPGLVSARGKRLDARDVLFSWSRAQKQGGAAVLAELPVPLADPTDPLAVNVPGADVNAVALALASPLTALVPRGFSPAAPDGTGAFRASVSERSLLFEQNTNAARGAAFLGRIEVTLVLDLAEALRAFEADRADLGWLGGGLHRSRAGSVAFEGPSVGWVVLRTGRDAGRWGAPGIAQQLLDRIPREPLRPFGIVLPATGGPGAIWGGGDAELLSSSDVPQLVRAAETLATLLSAPGQRVTSRPVARAEFEARRASGRFSLLLDFVRSAGPPGRTTLLSLLAAASPELAARPPRMTSYEPSEIARTLPLGVVGALSVTGARIPELSGLEAWQLGSVFRVARAG
jgi:peptide/nickel transport system substrate-binding protein